jgi:aspartate kinase
VITQGFIGATDENESTTLGREGSDFSAAIFANILNAESVTIWKDVDAVMSADPKKFPDASIIPALSYTEVIEMAYYGAQVIHPKTIKPLQNKSIPLLVKCFLNADLPGTIIHNSSVKGLPPIIVVKSDQVFIELHTKDFSFIGDEPMSNLYALFGQWHIKPNLIQSGAVSVQLCMDNKPEKLEKFAAAAAASFDVDLEKGFTLLTIRHYKKELVEGMTAGKTIRLMQQTPETIQLVINN